MLFFLNFSNVFFLEPLCFDCCVCFSQMYKNVKMTLKE